MSQTIEIARAHRDGGLIVDDCTITGHYGKGAAEVIGRYGERMIHWAAWHVPSQNFPSLMVELRGQAETTEGAG